MVVEEVIGTSAEVLAGVVLQVGKIALWLQALGIVILVWIIFQAINIYLNKKRMDSLMEIKKDVYRIENKINRILKKFS